MGNADMTSTLVVMVLFVGAMAMLPWLVRRVQQRFAGASIAPGVGSRVMSAVAIGPHQRVVTVEVGPEHARAWLILGVTAQQVTCLHVVPVLGSASPDADAPDARSFSREMAQATRHHAADAHG